MLMYLVRHGETTSNAEGRIQGQCDTPLSPLGIRQGAALAAAFRSVPLDAVFASPLSRALDTAKPLAEALNLKVHTDDRLMELNAGIFQGLLWSEVQSGFPDEALRWKNQDPDFVIPGGESRRLLMDRGRAALEAIRGANFARVAVVAHGGILAAALKSLLNIPAGLNPFSFYNASISKLSWAGTVEQIKLLTVNQIEHLRAAGLDREDRTGDL